MTKLKEQDGQLSPEGKEIEFDARASYDSDANDYYHEWVEVCGSDYNLVSLFEYFLGIGLSCAGSSQSKVIRVKAKSGRIILETKD